MDFKKFLPYTDFRPNQLEIIEAVYNSVIQKRNLIIDAPNGFGKTLAVLIGLIPHIIHDDCNVFYLTRTNREVKRVEDEVFLISSRFPIPALAIKSKKDTCVNEDLISKNLLNANSFNSYCNYLVKIKNCPYYENFVRLRNRIDFYYASLINTPLLHYEVRDIGINIHCCPYEIQRILIKKAKFIISTYNYLFLPEIFPEISLLNKNCKYKVLVVDEAHNLFELFFKLLQSELDLGNLSNLSENIKDDYLKNFINSLLITFKEGTNTILALNFIDKMNFSLSKLIQAINKEIIIAINEKWRNKDFYSLNQLNDFIKKLQYVNEESILIHEKIDDISYLYLINFNYKDYFNFISKIFTSKIFVSATIKPHNLFLDFFNLSANETQILEVNPFKESKLFSIFEISTTTRFKERSDETFERYINMLVEISEASKRNLAIFASSYNVLELLLKNGFGDRTKKNYFIEERSMSQENAEIVLNKFKEGNGKILLAVQGGKFSEGEDFPSNCIDIVVILGLAYEPPSSILAERIKYFNRLYKEKGFIYSYIIPAIRKAIQSAGRAFRGPNDRGIAIFLDSRFSDKIIMENLPWWYIQKKVLINWSYGKFKRLIRKYG